MWIKICVIKYFEKTEATNCQYKLRTILKSIYVCIFKLQKQLRNK